MAKVILFKFFGTGFLSTYFGIFIGSGIFFGLGFVKLKGFCLVGSLFSGFFRVSVFWISNVDSKVFTKSLFFPVAFSDKNAKSSAT